MEKYMPENNGGTRIPQTIEELKAFCAEKGMPLEKMRFFIGENIQEPKAFGIYRYENDRFVVYKNKADGSRAVRYSGPDEAYAVRELYLKLKSEVDLRRSPGGGSVPRKRGISTGTILLIVFLVLLFLYCKLHKAGPRRGYYRYEDDYYYYQNDDWYAYDAALDSWYLASGLNQVLYDDYDDYWQGAAYYDDYGVEDFEDTEYYEEPSDSDSDSDDDWDVDFDSWDSGDTDWGSDW